jgi:hypothetical protein
MVEFTCPVCDGHNLDIREIIVEESDAQTKTLLNSHSRTELKCQHCGWFGTKLQTTIAS